MNESACCLFLFTPNELLTDGRVYRAGWGIASDFEIQLGKITYEAARYTAKYDNDALRDAISIIYPISPGMVDYCTSTSHISLTAYQSQREN